MQRAFMLAFAVFIFQFAYCQNPLQDKVAMMDKGMSLLLLENKGQIRDQNKKTRNDIDFKIEDGDITIFVGAGQLHYEWIQHLPCNNGVKINAEVYRLDMVLDNCNTSATISAEDITPYYEMHYLASGGGSAMAKAYKKVIYHDVYPHIDWILYCSQNGIKYDFIVKPGGKVKDIKLKYEGVSTVKTKAGNLEVTTPAGTITEQKPYSYEQTSKRAVACSYIVSENTVSFDISEYTGTLVIDPALNWATYYGSDNSEDYLNAVGSDMKGNIYTGGTTFSINNIATTGAHKQTISISGADAGDAFLVKFNAAGTRQWATYYGGDAAEDLTDLAVSATGNIYITGFTQSDSGIATQNSYQSQYGGGPLLPGDIFLAKFNSDGMREWGTYYGGYMREDNARIRIDADDNIILAGTTSSSNAIASANAAQTMINGGGDGFIAKFNSKGVRLWGTYSGGNEYYEALEAVTTDMQGNIYVAGYTTSSTDLTTPGTHQTTLNTPLTTTMTDGFILKYDADGNKVWGTYFGGEDYDYIKSLICDENGDLYAGGRTLSLQKIASPGAFQQVRKDDYDGFVAKFTSTGNLQWSTYIGGHDKDEIRSFTVDKKNQLYIAGTTKDSFMTTNNSLQVYPNGDADIFLSLFDKDGNRKYATYFGGNNLDELIKAYNDHRGNILLGGNTQSTAKLATPGAFKQYYMSTNLLYDGFIAKLNTDTTVFFDQYFEKTGFCIGESLNIKYDVTLPYNSGNVFYVQLSDETGNFANGTMIGQSGTSGGGMIACHIPINAAIGTKYRMRIIATNKPDTSYDNGINLSIGTMPVVHIGNNSPLCAGDTLSISLSANQAKLDYEWNGPNNYFSTIQQPVIIHVDAKASGDYIVKVTSYGCVLFDTTSVIVNPLPDTPVIRSNSPVCLGMPLSFEAVSTPGATFKWSGPDGFSSPIYNPSIDSATMSAYGIYTVIATLSGCTSAPAQATAVVKPLPEQPVAGSNSPICEDDTLKLFSDGKVPGILYKWTGPKGFSIAADNAMLAHTLNEQSGIYILTASLNGCTKNDSINAVIKSAPRPVIVTNSPIWENEDLKLSVGGTLPGTDYLWIGPAGFISNLEAPVIKGAGAEASGIYNLTAKLNGCTAEASSLVMVYKLDKDFLILFPNPNNGRFSIRAKLKAAQEVYYEVLSATGQMVYQYNARSAGGMLQQDINLEDRLSNGTYYFRMYMNGNLKSVPFTVSR